MKEITEKILIVDDEAKLRKLIEHTFSSAGYRVALAHDGREGISFSTTEHPDIVILDLGLPDIGGLEVLREIRKKSDVPVIILSVQSELETVIKALNSGADDYMTKPFEPAELLARTSVCLRRTLKRDFEEPVFEAGHLRVDLGSRIVTKNGEEIKLTSTEYDLLKFFIKNANKILTSQQILSEVWGPGSLEQVQYPRVYVRHLRRKLEENPDDPQLILTEAGVGYRLKK